MSANSLSTGKRPLGRYLYLIPLVVGTASVATGLALAGREALEPTSGRLEVEHAKVDLGVVSPGQHSMATFALVNTGGRPVTLLGANCTCSTTACGGVLDELPITLAPSERHEIKTEVFRATPGPIDYPFELYSDGPGQTILTLTIAGIVLDALPAKPPGAE